MTEKTPFNKNGNTGGGFDFYDYKNALAKQYGKQNAEFFAMAWRQMEGALLEQASRFTKLVDWCDKEIRQAGAIINTFSPADNDKTVQRIQFFPRFEQIKQGATGNSFTFRCGIRQKI